MIARLGPLLVLWLAVPAVALFGLAVGLVDWSGQPEPSPPRAVEAAPAAVEETRAVREAVRELGARRAALRQKLADARRPVGQAATARALADAYGRASEALAQPSAAVPAAVAIRAALGDTESAYRRLAATARARDPGQWRRASRATRQREAQLERTLRDPASRD